MSDPLIERLSAPDRERRARAVEAVVARGPAALPLLYRVLAEGGLLARHAALEALGRLALPEAAPVVEPLLRDYELRGHAAEVLVRLGSIAEVETVIRAAAGGSQRALGALIASPHPDRVLWISRVLQSQLGRASSDDTSDTGVEAAAALGIPGEERAVPMLRRALEAMSLHVQIEAARSLGRIGTPAAVEALGGEFWLVSGEAARARIDALAEMGELGAAALARQLTGLGGQARLASMALERMGTAAVPPLCDVARSGWLAGGGRAMALLGQIGDRRALPVLASIARSEAAPWQRGLACTALGKLGDPEAMPLLRDLLESPSRSLRGTAAAALVTLGEPDPGLIPHLVSGIQTGEGAVQHDCAAALTLLAERAPAIELRAAMPRLRWLAAPWLPGQEARRVYRSAIERIVAATDSRSRLPLPASSPTTDLPLPSSAPPAGER